MIKRAFDILVAVAGLVLLSPLYAIVAALVKLGSPGPHLFRQERIGRRFRPFTIYKFRTMRSVPELTQTMAMGDDSRVTGIGRFLRRTKLDEVPQLINVLKGDMSLVGPRPELRQYVDRFRLDYEEILQVRPGMTDPASIKYRNESERLAAAADPEAEYVGRILPDKIRLAREYVRRRSFVLDLVILAKTVYYAGREDDSAPVSGTARPNEEPNQ